MVGLRRSPMSCTIASTAKRPVGEKGAEWLPTSSGMQSSYSLGLGKGYCVNGAPMCGIIGYVGYRPAVELLVQGLRVLEYRGYDSWGLGTVSEGSVRVTKRVGKISESASADLLGVTATTGIGHTRWATHGAATPENAHPHTDSRGTLAVVHNGIIENSPALRQELESRGVLFRSETDPEVIPHLLAQYYDGDPVDALKKVMRRLVGAFAIAVILADRARELFGARRGSPLALGVGEKEMFLASDPRAFVAHTRKVVYLDDEDIARLTPDEFHIDHMEHGRVEHADQAVAALDAVVEEVQGHVTHGRVDPQAHLGELHGHGVQVHPVDRVLEHVALGPADRVVGHVLLARADLGQAAPQVVVGRNEKRGRPAGRIAHLDRQEGLDPGLGRIARVLDPLLGQTPIRADHLGTGSWTITCNRPRSWAASSAAP